LLPIHEFSISWDGFHGINQDDNFYLWLGLRKKRVWRIVEIRRMGRMREMGGADVKFLLLTPELLILPPKLSDFPALMAVMTAPILILSS
jgi:hypothetical protein